MNDWPEDWYRKERLRPHDRDSAGNAPPDAATARYSEGRYPGGQTRGYPAGNAGNWPEQPPLRTPADRGAPGGGAPPRLPGDWAPRGLQPQRRRLRPKRIVQGIAVLIAAIIVASAGLYFYLNSKLTRVDALVSTSATSAGQNWVITGSAGNVTRSQASKFHVGYKDDPTADTIMLLHIPSGGGRPVLVSLPRDSYVPIPGHGYNKINATFSIGGPKLLVQTVQDVTGLRINHYMALGYAGFVSVVNDVGGVTMCLPAPLKDSASGVNLKAGCQKLNGIQALAFARDRHNFPTQDLQRIQDERLLVKALLAKMTSAGTLANPFATVPATIGTAKAITVDQSTQLYQLVSAAFALRNPLTTTVPIAHANYFTSAGDAVLWNHSKAVQLFNDLKSDTQPPANLITGSQVG